MVIPNYRCVVIKSEINIKESFSNEILDFCKHIAHQQKVIAVAEVDFYASNKAHERTVHEIMLVINNFQPLIMSYLKIIQNKTVYVFAVDQRVIEQDIIRGFLGEAIASKLIFPYHAINGKAYLSQKENELKERLVLELLENIVINFPEIASRISILPQYFLYEVISSRIRAFPLLAYETSDLSNCLIQNEAQALFSYQKALSTLESQGMVIQQQGYFYITPKFISQRKSLKSRIINLSKNAPRTLFSSLFGVLPQLISIVTQNMEVFLRTQKVNWLQPNQTSGTIDPYKYVFFPTAKGNVSLSEKIDVKGYAQRMLKTNQTCEIEVKPVGSMLNDVYLIKAGEDKVLAKRFKDWSGFKWFPLTLWSFGARSFAVSGQARLAKECAISEHLLNEGFNIPKILNISNSKRIVFMEFIEGENLSQAIKRYSSLDERREVLDIIEKVGEIIAQVHSCDISLGDAKPDNVLVKANGMIYLVDFEQAQHGGDKAWDIAVFLYYCGHYLQAIDGTLKAASIAIAFIKGYLRAGGNIEEIRKASSAKYIRVFSVFTLPSIVMAISNVCRKAQNN